MTALSWVNRREVNGWKSVHLGAVTLGWRLILEYPMKGDFKKKNTSGFEGLACLFFREDDNTRDSKVMFAQSCLRT